MPETEKTDVSVSNEVLRKWLFSVLSLNGPLLLKKTNLSSISLENNANTCCSTVIRYFKIPHVHCQLNSGPQHTGWTSKGRVRVQQTLSAVAEAIKCFI